MKIKKIIWLILIVSILLLIGFFFRERYIIGIVEEVNEFTGIVLVTPREMSPSKLIPSATFRIKLDIDVKSGSIIKLHIKPTIKYFFNTVFNPSVINPYFLPEEIEYSVEIIKK